MRRRTMETSAPFGWSDRFTSGSALMDHTHKEFVLLVDALKQNEWMDQLMRCHWTPVYLIERCPNPRGRPCEDGTCDELQQLAERHVRGSQRHTGSRVRLSQPCARATGVRCSIVLVCTARIDFPRASMTSPEKLANLDGQ
jgi:hypothetical protein